jgi:uncharacterized protein (DUF58 family)
MADAWTKPIAAGYHAGLGYALLRPSRTPAGLIGEQLGSSVGSSVEFMDYREYTPGDDLRRVDWSVYGRTDRLVIKLHREEVTPHLDVLIDASRSMALAGSDKPDAVLGLAAAISAAADNARWSRRLYAVGEQNSQVPGGEGNPQGWVWPGFDSRQPLGMTPITAGLKLRRRGVRVLISDLLFDSDPWPIVSRLAEGASALFVVQLLASQDADPPWNGDLRLVDSETGLLREIRMDSAARERYLQRLQTLRQQWSAACRRVDGRLIEMIAEDLTDGWDLRPLVECELLRLS